MLAHRVAFLKRSPGLKDWILFPELGNIYQTQHTHELSERIRATLNWEKALLLVAGRLILLNGLSCVVTLSYILQMKDIIPPREIAVTLPNESEDVILIWTPFVECLYENYEI